jgi:hypothetical protein
MRNVIKISLYLSLAAALCTAAVAHGEVTHIQVNRDNLFVKVSGDPWQPDGFVNGTAVPAAYLGSRNIEIDGRDNEAAWQQASEVQVPLAHGLVQSVSLKALYTDDEVFIRVRWADDTENRQYHPWVWDADQKRFVEGPQVEDSVLLSFEAGCEWTPSLLSGYIYDFDGWQWLAARSDPLGQAVDMIGNVQDQHLGDHDTIEFDSRYREDAWNMKFRAQSNADLHADWDGNDRVYMLQPINHKVYLTMRPDAMGPAPAFVERLPAPGGAPQDASMTVPQFSPIKLRDGAGEVSAKGNWEDGYWTVEFRRVRETPQRHFNDVVFQRITQFSVHVFDKTEQIDESSESGRLFLKFLPPETQLVSN